MGTGMVFGNGSGSSGSSSGNGVGGAGSYEWRDNKLVDSAVDLERVKQELKDTISRLLSGNSAYFDVLFKSNIMSQTYQSLFTLNREVFHSNKSTIEAAQSLGASYGLNPTDEGFLKLWANSVVNATTEDMVDQRLISTVRETIDDFLIMALGDNPGVYLSSKAEDVVQQLDRKVFRSTSANFLKIVLSRLVRREFERKRPEATAHISTVTEAIANDMITSYQNKFTGAGYENLFEIIREQPDWFRDQLRKVAVNV